MNDTHDTRTLGHGSYVLNYEASADTLMQDTTTWISHVEGIQELLADYIAETALPNRRLLAQMIGAAGVLTHMTAQALQQANVRRMWDDAIALGGAK